MKNVNLLFYLRYELLSKRFCTQKFEKKKTNCTHWPFISFSWDTIVVVVPQYFLHTDLKQFSSLPTILIISFVLCSNGASLILLSFIKYRVFMLLYFLPYAPYSCQMYNGKTHTQIIYNLKLRNTYFFQ